MAYIMLCLKCLLVTLVLFDLSAANIQPCKISDEACINTSAQAALKLILAGDSALGVQTSDPIFIKEIDGNLSILKYTLTDSTVTGYKSCDIHDVKLDLEKNSLKFNLTCPFINLVGKYVASGRLIVLPVEGNGTYTINTKNYEIGVDAGIKTGKGKDGENHLQIKNFKLTLEAHDKVAFDFTNLFNGQKELADAVLKFANENWKEVSEFVQPPAFDKAVGQIITNVNKYLKTIPLENLFVQ